MSWSRALLTLACGCRIGFHDVASTIIEDSGVDAIDAVDAMPQTRLVTFGERSTSMVTNVTTDAQISQGAGTSNFGATADMSIYIGIDRGLVRFDLTSLTSADRVIAAVLELGVEASGDQIPGTFDVIRLDESWVEPGVTWQSRDGTTLWSNAGGTGSVTLATQTVGATVDTLSFALSASDVQGWIDAPATNHGMVLSSADGHWHLTSRDNSTDSARPQLILTLVEP